MTDNRDFFRDTAERILADTLSVADIEAVAERKAPQKMFDALVEAGITLMLASEDAGGIEASLAEAVTVLRAAGEAAAPGPLVETMLGQSLLGQAGMDVTEGWLSLVLLDGVDAPTGDVWSAPPVLHDVFWGGMAENIVVVLRDGDNVRVVKTASADWTVTADMDTADEPRDRLEGANIACQTGVISGLSFEDVLRTASILRAGQILGAVEWTLNRTVEYAKEREQFGRMIGKFQAVQQMLAELAGHTLASSGITEAAAEGATLALVAAARSRLADASDAAITIGHQVHGAMGFSREYPMNYRTRRLMAWRDDYGTVSYWRRELAGGFTGMSRENFWLALADSGHSSAE